MESVRTRLLQLSLIAGPAVVLACGPFFYPAPPTLDRYPERLPVKTMTELLREVSPRPDDAASFDQLAAETDAIARDLQTAPRDEMLRRIDAALIRNRQGEYRKRFANCLHDFHDLIAGAGAPAEEIQRYVAWRVPAMESDDGSFQVAPPAQSWQFTPAQLAKLRTEWELRFQPTADLLGQELEKASPPLRPHWLVQAGAWQFRHKRFADAAQLFLRVIEQHPQHPRAEVARLMLARVRMEEWRAMKQLAQEEGREVAGELSQKYTEAQQALDDYLAAHLQGRFAPDVPGWRAGLAREDGQIEEALRLFLLQTDNREHPEIVRRALREAEACLTALDSAKLEERVAAGEGSGLALEEIAQRPIAALAVVYHFLDSESRRDFEGLMHRYDHATDDEIMSRYTMPVLRMRRAGRGVLPALARAVVNHKVKYDGNAWQPKYLAILAWAASEAGEHQQATAICALAGGAIDTSDDLMFVRAVALQRAGEWDQAITAFQRIQELFPESPLTDESRFRAATVLRDNGEPGLAAVELMRLITKKARLEALRAKEQEPASAQVYPSLHVDSELRQWVDTLLQFAPLPQLEGGLAVPHLEPEITGRVREILRQRYLAREDFANARRFEEPVLTEAQDAIPGGAEPRVWLRRSEAGESHPAELKGEEWRTTVEHLARSTMEMAQTREPLAKAERCFALAEAWTAVRGHLTLPSTEDFDLCRTDFYQVWAQRYRNALAAGFVGKFAVTEIEGRDELTHAYRYYLTAANTAPASPIAARALWRANEALRRMAELSPWSAARAFEADLTGLSRSLHERLLREHPSSVEAEKLSVWWYFPPAVESRWMPGTVTPYLVEVAIADAFQGRRGAPSESPVWDRHPALAERLRLVGVSAFAKDPATLLQELTAIRRDLLPVVAGPNAADLINHLDDLELFLQEPGVTPSAQTKYFSARLTDTPPNLADPELQPWSDYLTFLALVREPPHTIDPSTGERHHRPMSVRMREFLEKFPKSRKREAAMARLAVASVREAIGRTKVRRTEWPNSPKLGGYYTVSAGTKREVNVSASLAAMDAYEREFPSGRYVGEMRLWRGAASLVAGDWRAAISLLTATIDDKAKRDLHLDASIYLADAFMRLLAEPESRQGIIAAVRTNSSAQARLEQFMNSDTFGARLRCLEGYLAEQFAQKGDQ